MKIKFTKLPTTDGTIKISLDGGQSFTDYNVADVHESGIPLEDNQDYEKIQIQAPANVLKNLNVISSVKVEGEGAETASNAIGNFRASLQTIAKQIKNSLQNRKNDLQQSGPDAIDKKYRNSIEQPIFLALKGLLELDDIYNALQNNDRASLQTEYQNCTNEFTNVLALAQNEISGFITRYNYSPKNFKGAAVTNNYFVRTNLENLGKDGGFSHYQCFEKDKLHNHLD